MVSRRGTFLAPLAIAAAALPGLWVGSRGWASATGTSTGGDVRLYQVDDKISDTSGPVTLTGAVGDYGYDQQGLNVGGTETNVLTFPDGKLALNLSTFGTQEKTRENPSTCSFTTVLTGLIPIIAGSPDDTGIYKHARGTFQVAATFAGVVPGQAGSCDFSQWDNTDTGLFYVEATGVIFGIQERTTP
jgi:hypothetical protein